MYGVLPETMKNVIVKKNRDTVIWVNVFKNGPSKIF